MAKVLVRGLYAYDTDQVSAETGLECLDPSLAQQHQAEDADINTIVRRFGLTGQLPQNVRPPMYGDFGDGMDYRSSLHAIMAARDSFMKMPAHVRQRFGHDPAEFVDFCSNPENLDEMRKLGLAVPKASSEAVVAPSDSGSGSTG